MASSQGKGTNYQHYSGISRKENHNSGRREYTLLYIPICVFPVLSTCYTRDTRDRIASHWMRGAFCYVLSH